jgi:hypothetical protein
VNEATVFGALAVTSIVLIGFVLFVLWLRLALEMRLVLYGVALAVFAAWCGALGGGVSVRGSGRPDVTISVPGEVAGGLLKLAVVLALGGVGLAFLHRGVTPPHPAPPPPPPPEHPRDVPPSV